MSMRIELQAIPVALQGLPAAMEGQRFFVLSDLHMHAPGPLYDGMISAARAAKPHLIFLCGDLIDEHTPDAAILEPVFTALRAIAPVVAINGNNDAQPGLTAALHALYRKCDITLLENEARDYTVDDASIHIIGVQDPEFYTVFPQEGEVKLTEPEMRLRGLLPADSGEDVNIFPYNGRADVLFNSALVYELSVLKKYAQPLLEAVKPEAEVYSEAVRMLKFIRFFDVIENEKDIPNNSIMREFIGGSVFVE